YPVMAALLRRGCRRRVFLDTLAGALEFPQPLPETPGNLGQLLPAKEKQGDQQHEQEILRCEDVGLDKIDPSHRPLSLCHTERDDQPLDVSQDESLFFVMRHEGGGARARRHPSATPPPSFSPVCLVFRHPGSVPPCGCAGPSRGAWIPHPVVSQLRASP